MGHAEHAFLDARGGGPIQQFFNGGNEKPYDGEEREMVPSPKVATYDLKPEMSAQGVKDVVVKAIEKGGLDVVVMNFANADMVGHSGKMEPTVRAVETVDACLGDLRNVEASRRLVDDYRRSWECRNYDRSFYQGSTYLSHAESRAVCPGR